MSGQILNKKRLECEVSTSAFCHQCDSSLCVIQQIHTVRNNKLILIKSYYHQSNEVTRTPTRPFQMTIRYN